MSIKQLLAQLGLGPQKTTSRVSPITEERVRFEKDVREQFEKLKEKGLSIPVFTL